MGTNSTYDVLIVYVPRHGESEHTTSENLHDIEEVARKQGLTPVPLYYTADTIIDIDEMAENEGVERVVTYLTQRNFNEFKIIWIAGGGWSTFARLLIEHLVRQGEEAPHLGEHVDEGSALQKRLAWYKQQRTIAR